MSALAFASIAYSEILPFSERYYDDFYEGEEMTLGLGELDTVVFTYYGTNYSIRVLSIYSESATLRVENKAFDMQVGETRDFDLDTDDILDLNITLTYTDSDEAMFNLILNKIEEEPPVENVTNTTNSTATNSTNATNSSSGNSSSGSNSNSSTNSSSNTSPQTASASASSNAQNTQASKSSKATGDVVYNINIDISIPPGSGVGVLMIIAIVLGGLFVYKKVRKRHRNEDEETAGLVAEKKPKKQPRMKEEEFIKADRKAEAKKAVRNLVRKTGKAFTTGRKRFAEIIAGDSFVRKPRH